ncbi:MAG: Na+/H+ antiporter subunit E [Candidatus Omnitrophica bacterium]|nr:Na+/H+ antiporter subunit E [Candidatus Omnitrophota bacterium]MCM8791154.1 Na+/H+ antiporter subunit E [Candidatus Omnitrophota bacterium]
MRRKISLFLLWFFVWIGLSWPPALVDAIYAVAVSLFVSYMTLDLMFDTSAENKISRCGKGKAIARPFWFLWYVMVFVWECFKANIDVAYRVLHPALPIRPGTIKVKVDLKSDIGLAFLANSLTLTPGRTTVDIDKPSGYLYVHCLSIRDGETRLPVVTKYEKILKKIFE